MTKMFLFFFSHSLLCVSFHSYYFLCWLLFYLFTESWGWHCLSLHVCVCTISSKTYTLMSDFSLELTIYRLSYPPDIATKTIFSETFHLQQVYETHVFLLLRYELSVIYLNEYTIYPFISDSLHYPNWYCLVLDSHQISARLLEHLFPPLIVTFWYSINTEAIILEVLRSYSRLHSK